MSISLQGVALDVRKHFDPLAQRLGLRGPTLELANTYFNLAYFGDMVGLQVLVELDHFFVLPMLFRMSTQDTAPIAFVGPTGEVHKMYLQEALDKLRMPHWQEQEQLRRLGGDYRNCDTMATILAALVEKTWLQARDNADTLFPQAG